MPEQSKKFIEKLENSFLGFWVKKYKVSFLFVILLALLGSSSLMSIPKDSSPKLDLGYISIVTPYTGVNPEDIDGLITEKIEREIKEIEGIKKITSSSVLGMSNIQLELEIDAISKDVLDEVEKEVDKVSLPGGAEDTIIREVDTEDNMIFQYMLYADEKTYSHDYLLKVATEFKNNVESTGAVNKVSIGGGEDYEVKVLLDKEKIQNLQISPSLVASKIREFNKNTPIGNYRNGDLNYDFRFDGEVDSIEEFKSLPILTKNNSVIYISDIATIDIDYKNENIVKFGKYNEYGYNGLILTIERKPTDSIFGASEKAKKAIDSELAKNLYDGIEGEVIMDMSEILSDDYKSLAKNMSTTLAFVFFIIFVFVGFKEGLIAIIIIPLSYLITFIVLDKMGYALNFLTNFSLILSLGVAIDTIIVVIEGAHKKVNLGYKPRHAILLATREYAAPIISGTMTTLAAFLPMMFLPGVMGKYLAYIPITVFITLLASLFLSLTITSPIFMKLVRDNKYYKPNKSEEETLTGEQKTLLTLDRASKIEKKGGDLSFRDKIFYKMGDGYYSILTWFMSSRLKRWFIIILPVICLFGTFKFFNIGFVLFPSSDNPIINITVEAQDGSNEDVLEPYIDYLNTSISEIEEVDNYNISISDNVLSSQVELLKKDFREDNGLRNSFEVEKEISEKMLVLKEEGLKVESGVREGGPPSGKAVGVKLYAESTKDLDALIETSKEFAKFLQNTDHTKNVGTSSSSTPGQFVFKFDKAKLADLGISPSEIENEVFSKVNGASAGTYKGKYDDYDIVVKIEDFDEYLSAKDLSSLVIQTSAGTIKVSDVAEYDIRDAISNIDREDTRISIRVESDVEDGYLPTDVQPKLVEFAEKYSYPEGVSYVAAGEADENRELIVSTLISFVVTLFLIFGILVLQFNSYGQPAIILYSVVLALLGVNIGLYLLDIPYSMPFAIGFIALTGIVINNAIIYIDKVNSNLQDGLARKASVLEAGRARLTPMLVTTMTTIFGITPLGLEDAFWAGLAFTMVFGLIAGTIMTLFVIPSLYYQIFLYKYDKADEKRASEKIINLD